MTADILVVTGELIDLFKRHDLSRVQSMFVLKACEMQINEEVTRDIIEQVKKGHDNLAGIG